MAEAFDTEIEHLCERLGSTTIDHSVDSSTLSWATCPPELLAQIFIRSTQDCEVLVNNGLQYPKLTATSPLLTVSHTCSHWRATAIGLPELWNHIGFQYAPSVEDNHTIQSPLLHTWLERSRPLAIHLSLAPKYTLISSGTIEVDIVDAIASHSSRLASLCIDTVGGKALAPLLFPAEDSAMGLSSLKRLTLNISILAAVTPFPITGFKDCQSLTHLSLNLTPSAPSVLQINWEQLTELNMLEVNKPLYRSRWMQLIRLCKSLRKGSFLLTSQVSLAANQVDRLVPNNSLHAVLLEGIYSLEFLEELTIEGEGSETLSSLIYNLRLPALKKLHVRTNNEGYWGRMQLGTWTKLHQLSSLTSLTICQVDMNFEGFVSLLGTLPLLQELRVDMEALPLVEALQIDRGPGTNEAGVGDILLPKLSKLDLWARAYDLNHSTTYAKMLRSRNDWRMRGAYDEREAGFEIYLLVDATKGYAPMDSLDLLGLGPESSLRSSITVLHVSPHHRL